MKRPRKPDISLRKIPQQARSSELVIAVLQAAVQVLTAHGAARFTMARVAEKAGVSVGSLYQYFPNKAAILFRLQSDEWRETSELLRSILEDTGTPPLQRLRALVGKFIQSECDEARIRGALGDAAPLYRDAPETKKARAYGERTLHKFMREALPDATDATLKLATQLVGTTLSSVGKTYSQTPRNSREIDTYANALADMFCGYLAGLGNGAIK